MRILSILLKIIAGVFLLFFLIILFIRSPWGQNIIKDKAISYLAEKTNTTITLDRLYLTFTGNVSVDGLYIEDLSGDTLLYSKKLTANVPLWPILVKKRIDVDYLEWSGVRANIVRPDSVTGFNYQFLLDAFESSDTTVVSSDTSSSGMEFSLGTIDLTDIDALYQDEVGGLNISVNLGSFKVKMKSMDLDQMEFSIASASLDQSHFEYIQSKPFPASESGEDLPLPLLALRNISINNLTGTYRSDPDGMLGKVDIHELELDAPSIDLVRQELQVSNVKLNESMVYIHLSNQEPVTEEKDYVNPPADKAEAEMIWPDWKVRIDDISLDQNEITFITGDNEVTQGDFNPEAIALKDFILKMKNIYLEGKTAGAELDQLAFKEGSGLTMDEFTLSLKVTDESLEVRDLKFNGLDSRLTGDLSARYEGIQNLIEMDPGTDINIDLPDISVNLSEWARFQPDLVKNEYFKVLSKKRLTAVLQASGSLSRLSLKEATVNWGSGTRIFAAGIVRYPMDMDRIQIDLPNIIIQSGRQDLVRFLDEESYGIKFPEDLRLTAAVSGKQDDLKANARLQTTMGGAELSGSYQSGDQLAFDLEATIQDFQLDSLLQNEQLGVLRMTIVASGSGQDIATLDANFQSNIEKLEFNQYEIRNWEVSGNIKEGEGDILSEYKDENVDASLYAFIVLDSISPSIDVQLEVAGADLAALGVMDKSVAIAFDLNGSFKGNKDRYEGEAVIHRGTVVYENQSYKMGPFDMYVFGTKDTTAVEFTSDMLDLSLHSNTTFGGFTNAIISHINSYLTDSIDIRDTLASPVRLDMNMALTDVPVIRKVFLTGLERMDTITLQVAFDESRKKLDADLDLPYLQYSGIKIDSVKMKAFSDEEHFNFDFGLHQIIAGPVTISRTKLTSEIRDQKLYSILSAQYEDNDLIHVRVEAEQHNDTFALHLNPDSLIVDSKSWTIPASNQILLSDSFFHFQNFSMTHGNQQFKIEDSRGENILNIAFENFELDNIVSYFNPDTLLASGAINGFLEIREPFGQLGLIADLNVQDFEIKQVDMGTLQLSGESKDGQNYSLELSLDGGEADIVVNGNYSTEGEGDVSAQITINRINMAAVENFSLGEIKDASGYLAGDVSIEGVVSDPRYKGELHFSETQFRVSALDALFSLNEDIIRFDNSGLRFEDFQIKDEEGNTFIVNGGILTEDLMNPSFDLTLKANDFHILNSTREDNDLFYGQARFNANATVTGNLNLPKIDLQLDVGSQTNITYIMPQGQAEIEKQEGVVIFVNKQSPDDILTRKKDESVVVTGYDINAVVSVGKDAVFQVIISEETGDHFVVSGEGELNFAVYPNGQTTLTGLLKIEDGHYEMNLYNLVTRRFDIVKGSEVSWSGDIMEATLDVNASYRVETSAYALMASQTSGADVDVKNQYRRKLPFLVYLNIDGTLTAPSIDFDINMPEDVQGALGGQVYGRLQQLNDQEQELNKQVFSLLVLGQFYPDSGSDGSGGGIANVARDNINQALSDQLNMFSDRLLGDSGIELDFGLESYTDYQGDSPQRRTELDVAAQKKFLDDRLIVKVGSEVDIEGGPGNPQENNPLIGNVSVEYLLTESGNFRVRGFRKNVYENVIDGQTIVSGLALIFTQEFNKFDELWRAMLLKTQKDSKD